jgi:hypothetical protein
VAAEHVTALHGRLEAPQKRQSFFAELVA